MSIDLRGVTKHYGPTSVLDHVDLHIDAGSITAVLGPSGSGKTTLLRIIAGFERIESGRVTIGDRLVDDGAHTLDAQHRGVGYVPQDGALFPHLTVAGNIGFGVNRRERRRVSELIDLVGLAGLGDRYPHQLSGGQQQRVALARALAIRPTVVLLDEPFSALDANLRGDIRRDVTRILRETATTAVLVTHDQDEALSVADHVAVLGNGKVTAWAEPRVLYQDPPDVAAATSIGEANILPAVVSGGTARCALGLVAVRTGSQQVVDGPAKLLLRPEQVALHFSAGEHTVAATVVELNYYGHDALAVLDITGMAGDVGTRQVLARIPGLMTVSPGQTVWAEVTGTARAWADPPALSATD